LDYADQRFYASAYGRFNTPDRKRGSAHPKNPGSWNRYSYTLGDPINGNDPTGECPSFIACVKSTLTVTKGGIKIAAGIVAIGAASATAAGTAGLSAPASAVLTVGGIGAIISGGLDIASVVTGNPAVENASTMVSLVTNPAGYAVTTITYLMNGGDRQGAENAGTAAALVFDTTTSTATLINSAEAGMDAASGLEVAQVVTAPFTTAADAFGTGAVNLLNLLSPIAPPPTPAAPLPPADPSNGGAGGTPGMGSYLGITPWACQNYDIGNWCLNQLGQ